MAITYSDSALGLQAGDLYGFFVGWPSPPTPERHLELLLGSDAVELARDAASGRVIGFAAALTDGVLTLYISYLEVLPEYQGRGIGTELTRRLLARFDTLYAVDLLCDADVQPFYARLGLQPTSGMMRRRLHRVRA